MRAHSQSLKDINDTKKVPDGYKLNPGMRIKKYIEKQLSELQMTKNC